MFLGKVLKLVILTFSGIGVGGAFGLVTVHARDVIKYRNREAIDLLMARVGFVILVGLIAEAIAMAPFLDVHMWRVWVFAFGAVLAGAGYIRLTWRAWRVVYLQSAWHDEVRIRIRWIREKIFREKVSKWHRGH